MRSDIIVACAALVGVSLQGCGSTGAEHSAHPPTITATTTTFTSTTLTTTRIPPDPRDGQMIADLMNQEYNGYVQGDKDSSFGVFLRFTPTTKIFCHTPCFEGTPDCRISGSILNSKQMINRNTGRPGIAMNQGAGFYVNSTLIKTMLGKCTYAWDGSTMGKVNFGCGCQQGSSGKSSDCDKKDSPYSNRVPPDYKATSGAESSNVKPCLCDNLKANLPANGAGAQCFWKGVAFDTKIGDSDDETHKMLDWRINHTGGPGGGDRGDPMLAWNEMVLDGERMLEAMAADPAGTILAIVFMPGSQGTALNMAKEMQHHYKLPKPVPLIKVSLDVDVRSGNAKVFINEPSDTVFA